MGLLLITATGICSMMGASINVIPFMIQKNVPGIGPYVVPAFLFAAIPAVMAYNRFTTKSDKMLSALETFAEEFAAILNRQLHIVKSQARKKSEETV